MPQIVIISSSIRTGRNSHRVALYLADYLRTNKLGNVELLDLETLNFPLFHERLKFLDNPPEKVLSFSKSIAGADGVLIVTPEYNGGYPASLKNVIDLLYSEWKRKPVGLATVSAGSFGGSQVGPALAFTFLKIGALVTPAVFRVPTVEKAFNPDGSATEKDLTDKRAKQFLDEFFWCVEAAGKMKNNSARG